MVHMPSPWIDQSPGGWNNVMVRGLGAAHKVACATVRELSLRDRGRLQSVIEHIGEMPKRDIHLNNL